MPKEPVGPMRFIDEDPSWFNFNQLWHALYDLMNKKSGEQLDAWLKEKEVMHGNSPREAIEAIFQFLNSPDD